MSRRAAREKALQAMFQTDVGKTDADLAFEQVKHDLEDGDINFLKELFYKSLDHLDEIDSMISRHLENWTIDRLANVDRNLLRIAVYEMKFMDEIPQAVTINEAVEIAKIYGDEKSSKFINGLLSKVNEEL